MIKVARLSAGSGFLLDLAGETEFLWGRGAIGEGSGIGRQRRCEAGPERQPKESSGFSEGSGKCIRVSGFALGQAGRLLINREVGE